MHEVLKQFDTGLPYPDVFPESVQKVLTKRDYFQFRNLPHFCHVVSKMTQKEDNKCGMTYAEALRRLLKGESDFPEAEKAELRNLVRSNLFRRGLISEEVYEEYRYSVDGTVVTYDVAKYAAGEPDCIISPARQYIDFFYELYVSVSYPWNIANEKVRHNCAKLLATIEELERQHIFIKISLIFPDRQCAYMDDEQRNFFGYIPLFSHKDPKSVDTMSAVVNDRLLRKFFFAILENYYGDALASNYGLACTDIKNVMCIGNEFNEITFFEDVLAAVGAE